MPILHTAFRAHPNIAALCLGGLTALAFAPIGFFPIFWLCLPLFYRLVALENISAFTAAKRVWLFSFGGHLSGLYWISAALFTDIQTYWWGLPFSFMGLPFLLAFFPALPAYLFFKILKKQHFSLNTSTHACLYYISLASLLWLGDYARSTLFTGFPWNLPGYSLYANLPLAQGASLIGTYGLSYLIYLCPAFLALLPTIKSLTSRTGLYALLPTLLCFGGLYLWGMARLQTPTSFYPDLELHIVQQSIPQTEKWDPQFREQNLKAQISALQDARATSPADHQVVSILPETAITWPLNRFDTIKRQLTRYSEPQDLIIAGSLGYFPSDQGGNVTNSVYFLSGDLSFQARYDKSHLVPFGEYTPLFGGSGLAQTLGLGEGMTAGPNRRTIPLPNLPSVSPLICYEVIFPSQVVNQTQEAPKWLLNITNDGWYGKSAGPYQHFHIAQFRAIEEGLPLIRSGNNGISASIDSFGRVITKTTLNQITVLKTLLPKENTHKTVYNKKANLIHIFFLAITITAIFLCLLSSITEKSKKFIF